jgi:hypothetical protein
MGDAALCGPGLRQVYVHVQPQGAGEVVGQGLGANSGSAPGCETAQDGAKPGVGPA